MMFNLVGITLVLASLDAAISFSGSNGDVRNGLETHAFLRPTTHLHMAVGSALPEDREGHNENQRYQPENAPTPPEIYGQFEYDLNHLPPSQERQSRMLTEEKAMSRFVHGDELIALRKRVDQLKSDLTDARNSGDLSQIRTVKLEIIEAEQQDAELIYLVSTRRMKKAQEVGLNDEAEKFHQEAKAARSVLPQFNIEGLWVGKYGEHGYEMINVTYSGDILVARKVTGDKNVPKGEATFMVDLSPENMDENGLDPIGLSEGAAQQWGTKHLPRFEGKGQVAAEAFVNNQWVEGQLIMVGEYFSFAWVPLGHQIFFGRPSADLTLKMLKASTMKDLSAGPGELKDTAKMRAYAIRCWEETELLEDDVNGDSGFYGDESAFE